MKSVKQLLTIKPAWILNEIETEGKNRKAGMRLPLSLPVKEAERKSFFINTL